MGKWFFIKNAKIFKKWGNVFYKMLMLTFSKKYKIFFRKNARSGIGGSEGSCHIDVLVCMPDVKLPDR